MASDASISAYDLARDIVRELSDAVIVSEDSDGDAYESLDEDKAVQVLQTMIAAALKNGGIRA